MKFNLHCRNLHSVNGYDQENTKFNSETENLQDWILIVKHVVARDSGSYECQVRLYFFFYYFNIISKLQNITYLPQLHYDKHFMFLFRLPPMMATLNLIAWN